MKTIFNGRGGQENSARQRTLMHDVELLHGREDSDASYFIAIETNPTGWNLAAIMYRFLLGRCDTPVTRL